MIIHKYSINITKIRFKEKFLIKKALLPLENANKIVEYICIYKDHIGPFEQSCDAIIKFDYNPFDLEDQKSYYTIINKNLNAIQSLNETYLVDCCSISFGSIFCLVPGTHINRRVRKMTRKIKPNQAAEKITVIDSFAERAIVKRTLTIEEINKDKPYIKLKNDVERSKLIESLKQTIYRTIPKPIKILSHVVPLVTLSAFFNLVEIY